jgi:hypothetical protein
MDATQQQLEELKLRLETDRGLLNANEDLFQFFRASEYKLIILMMRNGIWRGSLPPNPGGTGEFEFGLICHWLNYPPAFIQDYIDQHEWLKILWDVFKFALPTQIDAVNYNNLLVAVAGGGVVADDGTLFGDKTYEQLDPQWVWAFVDYLWVRQFDDKAPFVKNTSPPIPLSGKKPNQVSIALVGDWGTGPYQYGPAIEIMKQIVALTPDYIVHLGDVYYAGTNQDFPPPNEEQVNFLNHWPTGLDLPYGNSFTLNSNHEMYSGAKGYFGIALTDKRFWTKQKGCSYFALQYAGWTILGLDSAYYSTSKMYMWGSIGGVTGTQGAWITAMGLSPSKVIVLTHHTGLSYDGAIQETLWPEVSGALKGDPGAWYWGHVHNGMVYKTPTVTGKKTLARCLGHGALPFGDAWGLANCARINYYAHTRNLSVPGGKRVYNGFVMLTINSNGQVNEAFYEQNNPNSVWSGSYSLGG